MDCIVQGVIKSRTRLSDLHFTSLQYLLVQRMFFKFFFFFNELLIVAVSLC